MNVIGNGDGQKGLRVEKEIYLGEMLEGERSRRDLRRRILGNGEVLDLTAVSGFQADIGDDVTCYEAPRYCKRGKKPGRLREKIVVRDRMELAVGPGPCATWFRRGGIVNFARCARRK